MEMPRVEERSLNSIENSVNGFAKFATCGTAVGGDWVDSELFFVNSLFWNLSIMTIDLWMKYLSVPVEYKNNIWVCLEMFNG